MNINKKYVLIGLLLLVVSWAGNIVYYQNHSLKEPFFLKHYYDVKQGMEYFNLYYIDNINSDNHINYVVFPEIGDDKKIVSVNNFSSDDRYYNMKVVNVQLLNNYMREIPEQFKNKVITKAKIGLSGGREIEFDIGKIYLYSDFAAIRGLEFESGGGGSDNTGFADLSSLKELKVYGLNSKFPELLNEIMDIQINTKALKEIKFPFTLDIGDKLAVNYKFKFNDNDFRKNNVYIFTLDVLTEDNNGEKGGNSIFIQYRPNFPEMYDIASMLKGRGDM